MLFYHAEKARRYRRVSNHDCRSSTRLLKAAAFLIGALLHVLTPTQGISAQLPPRDTMRVTFAEARRLAIASNPELLARRLDMAIARGNLRQAGNFRFNPAADALAASGSNGAELGLSQEIEVLGQHGARVAARRAGVLRADAGVANASRLIFGVVDRTFYRVISARERSLLADTMLALNRRLTAIAERQLAAGEISRLESNLAGIELGRAQSRALSEKREQIALSRELGRLLGLDDRVLVFPVLDSTQHHPLTQTRANAPADARLLVDAAARLNVDSLVSVAFRKRPDLLEQKAAISEATAAVSVAKREVLPNLVVRGVSEPAGDGSARLLRGGVGFTLPLLNRNRGEVQARRASVEQAELQHRALEKVIATEVANAIAAYQTSAAEIEVFETSVLPPARQNRVLLESAYREGKVGLPVLLLIRNQLGEAELDYWNSWLREREAYSALKEATGENTEALQAVDGDRPS